LKVDTSDSRLTDSRAEKLYVYQNTDSAVTGTTSQTVLFNGKINGGEMGLNGVLNINAVLYKIGSLGNFSCNMYLSTVGTNTVGSTGTPASSTTIASYAFNTLYGGRFSRTLANKNNQSLNNIFTVSNSVINDNGFNHSPRDTINFNTANDFWVVITGRLANAGDTGGLDNVQVQIDKP
jgi:hypothetical protein